MVGQRAVGLGQAVDAGDVNGDRIPDALVSAPGRRSIVYVVYGSRSWRRTIPVGGLTAEQGYRLVTDANIETLMPVANAGDVNGDGIPDQLIGIPNQPGTVYVVYGRRPGGTVDLDQLEPSQGYRIGGAPGDSAGTDVANAGDVNGDSIPDQLIGAPQSFMMPGRAYVVYGQRPGAAIDLATLAPDQGYRLDGAPFDEAGDAVRNAGDVNLDSVPDALVGAESEDHAYVVYGQRTATPTTVDLGVPGTWGYGMHGIPVTLTGASVDNAGDVNGDGLPDALIGGPACEADAPPTATVYVVYGQRTPPGELIELANISPQLGYRIVDGRGECAGIAVAGMPDLNGDGVPDQLIGAMGARWAGGDGAAFVVYGQRTTTPRLVDLVGLAPARRLSDRCASSRGDGMVRGGRGRRRRQRHRRRLDLGSEPLADRDLERSRLPRRSAAARGHPDVVGGQARARENPRAARLRSPAGRALHGHAHAAKRGAQAGTARTRPVCATRERVHAGGGHAESVGAQSAAAHRAADGRLERGHRQAAAGDRGGSEPADPAAAVALSSCA